MQKPHSCLTLLTVKLFSLKGSTFLKLGIRIFTDIFRLQKSTRQNLLVIVASVTQGPDQNCRDCLSLSFGGDTKSRRSLLSGVYARGSKISHQSALEMCNLSWTPHSNLEKDNSLNHSCVSPSMGCLEYT